MWLDSFVGENLRSVARVELSELGEVNVLYGMNGAGKTSVLEGIHLLGMARSFRTRRSRDLMQKGSDFYRAMGRVGISSADDSCFTIGVERRGGSLQLRVAGEVVNRTSELARRLPLFVIRPESHELVSGGSEERRRLMDWALFHVEHDYVSAHFRYRRVLAQRNSALRQKRSLREVVSWNAELSQAGSNLDFMRREFYAANASILSTMSLELVGMPVDIAYVSGWPDGIELESALASSIENDRQRGFTTVGAHRADLQLRLAGTKAKDVLSRGESKLLVLGVLLAHATYMRTNAKASPILLVDDLASELDAHSRSRFFSALDTLGCQSFITAVDLELIPEPYRSRATVFHVEQGQINRVV